SWRRLERQRAVCALIFAFDRAGNSSPARIAMMAMTTSSSTRVKAGSVLDLPPPTLAGPLDFVVFILTPRYCSRVEQRLQHNACAGDSIYFAPRGAQRRIRSWRWSDTEMAPRST